MSYDIIVEDGSGNKQSVIGWDKLVYEGYLNGNHSFDIVAEGVDETLKAKFANGNTVYIYHNGTLELKGVIDKRTVMSGGFLRIQGIGRVEKLLKDALSPDNGTSDWSALTTTVIMSDLSAYQPNLTFTVTDSQSVDSFRTSKSETLLYAINRYCDLASQDYSFNYYDDGGVTPDAVEIEDHHGSSTSIATFNEFIQISGLEIDENEQQKIKKVTVIGKGQGDAQITSSYNVGWSQGDAEKTIIDKSVDTTAEATARATAEYSVLNATRYTYRFTVLNPNWVYSDAGSDFQFTLGDVITLKSTQQGIDTTVRITAFKRSVTPNSEALSWEVRGTSERESAEDRLSQMAAERAYARDTRTMDQGNIMMLTYTDKDYCTNSSDSDAIGAFTLPSWITSSSQLKSATLTIRRCRMKYLTGDATEDAYTLADITNVSAYSGAGMTNIPAGGSSSTTLSSSFADAITFNGTNWVNGETQAMSATDTAIVFVTLSMRGMVSGAGGYGYVRVYDGTNYYPSSSGHIFYYQNHDSAVMIAIPADVSSKTLRLQFKGDAAGNSDTLVYDFQFQGIAEHTHSNTFDDSTHTNANTFNDAEHANDINQSVVQTTSETEPLAFNFQINSTTWTSAGNLSIGDITAEIDILSKLNDPAVTRVNQAKVRPAYAGYDVVLFNTITIKAVRYS
jgi:hypothetical protein